MRRRTLRSAHAHTPPHPRTYTSGGGIVHGAAHRDRGAAPTGDPPGRTPRPGWDAGRELMVTKVFRASRGGLSHPPEAERRGFGIPRGPRGEVDPPCCPVLPSQWTFPTSRQGNGRRIHAAAAVAAATASPGPYSSVFPLG